MTETQKMAQIREAEEVLALLWQKGWRILRVDYEDNFGYPLRLTFEAHAPQPPHTRTFDL